LTFAVFIKELTAGKIRPAYLLSGSEDYLSETAVKRLIDKLLTAEERDFNLTTYYGKEAQNLPETLMSLPVFAQMRLTVVKQAQRISAPVLERVVEYLQDPPSDGCLLLWANKLDKRSKFYKTISKTKIPRVECNPLKGRDLSGWINRFLSEQNKKLDPEAMARLTSVNWQNLYDLSGELEQLSLMTGENNTITVKDIQELGTGSFPDERWKLTDAVGDSNLSGAHEALNNLLKWNFKPVQVIGDLQRMFIKMWTISWYVRKNRLAKGKAKVGLHPFVFDKYAKWVRRIGTKPLENGIIRIAEGDFYVKTGIRAAELEVHMLVTELTRLTGARN